MKILLPLFLLISVSTFGQYAIPKDYFIRQFSDTTKLSRIYCLNKKGEKIWLKNIIDFTLTLNFHQPIIIARLMKFLLRRIFKMEKSLW
jgi:hypothetical protein